jgi:hypothetical protein
MKIAVFWVVAPCSLVEVYQRFRGPCSIIRAIRFTIKAFGTHIQDNIVDVKVMISLAV